MTTKSLTHLLLIAAVAIMFSAPLYRNWHYWGIQDWDVHTFLQAAPRATILEYGQTPLWNPWFCGGMPLLARPESTWLSPSFLLVLVFGALAGLKLQVAIHLWIGLTGAYFLGRTLGHTRLGAALCAAVVMLSGGFTLHITVGNVWVLNQAWMPWAVMCGWRAFRELECPARRFRCELACSIFLVLMWFGGGPYILVLSYCLLALLGVLGVVTRQQGAWQTLQTLLRILAFTGALGAVKFLPAMEFMAQYPRVHNLPTGYSLQSLAFGFLSRDQSLQALSALPQVGGLWRGYSQAMNETGAYVGAASLAFCLAGMFVARRDKWAWILTVLLLLWLCLGQRAPVSAWEFLHRLPVFDTMRVAERFRLPLTLCLGVLAGWGLDHLRRQLVRHGCGEQAVGRGMFAVVLAVCCDLALVVAPVLGEAFRVRPMAPTGSRQSPFVQTDSHYAIAPNGTWASDQDDLVHLAWSSHYPAFLANQGIVFGNEEIPVPMAAVPIESEHYQGEVWVEGVAGRVLLQRWTPNQLRIAVALAGPGTVVVNQNYFTGWRARDGRPVTARHGLLSVQANSGDRELELYYRPASFILGLLISVVAFSLMVVLWVRGCTLPTIGVRYHT